MTADVLLAASLVAYATEVCRAERVEVAWLGLDPTRLAAGGVPMWSGDPCRAHPELRLVWGQGDDVDVLTVRPRLGVWVTTRLAAAPAAVGEPIRMVDGLARLDVSGSDWTGEQAVATTAVRTGDRVSLRNARLPSDGVAGADVTVVVRVGSLEIRAAGRLIDAGRIGEAVRVENLATDAVVRGTLVDPNTVEL